MSVNPVSRSSAQAPRAAGLPQARNAQLSLREVWPYIEAYAKKYGADPKVLAGIIAQESSFKNFGVHYDGTGHGLIGLDDNGLLPSFERWTGQSYGRGANASTIPPEKQIEFLAKTIGELTRKHGSAGAAAREWHSGAGGMNGSGGYNYEALIKGHISRLFPGGQTPAGGTIPDAPASPGRPAEPSGPAAPSSPGPGGATAGESYHIVRGDTLWGIASRLKAQGMEGSHWDIIRQIQALNPKITNPNLIFAGDNISLPKVGASSFTPGGAPPVQIDPTKTNGPAPVENDRDSKAGSVPYISQYRPVGAEKGYSNGPANCGPTSTAMIARAFGYGKGMSDAQLINHLGSIGGTSSNGTDVNGIAKMARAMGKQATTKGPGPQIEWMKEQLRAGKLVVANGDYHAMPPHQNEGRTSGHYVCVAGLDANGNFIVRDPADSNVKTITAAQMAHFISSNPNGGWQISIG